MHLPVAMEDSGHFRAFTLSPSTRTSSGTCTSPSPADSYKVSLLPEASSNTRSKRSRAASRNTVPNSSSDGELIDSSVSELAVGPTRRVLKEVSISMGSKKGKAKAYKKPQADQESSLGSPSLENSDYETPGTSHSTTPAVSIPAQPSRKSTLAARDPRKRRRLAIMDSEEEAEEDEDLDTQLARQLQTEEYRPVTKRQRIGTDDDTPFVKSEEQTSSSKGKGKAKAVEPSSLRGRPSRASAAKSTILSGAFLSDEDDSGDEFLLEEDDLALDLSDEAEEVIDPVDSDDEPLISKRPIKPESPKPKGKKVPKSKRLTYAEKMAKKHEAAKRNARFAHIADKWDRKRAMNRERAEQNHSKLLTMWDDLAEIHVLEVQQADQPTSITRRLKPFQLEGLSWMTRQEKTGYKGGLLGDEMGMGKTIQAVSLIMSDYPAKEPTLVVVPPVALLQWSNEIREYTDGKLNVLVYHGTNAKCKKMSVKDLKKFDVIMVSYNSLESLHRKEIKGWSRGEDIVKEASSLHAIHYHRLILDEAHSIKSRTTGVAKACFALKGSYKWCLSGTPVQNRIGEFFSLLRFLEVRPFADYFCRSCDCEQLHWQVNEDHMCTACDHGGSEHISVFNQELLNPITGDDPELREDALSKLHMITARIMLRRMKRDHTNSMELPMKDVIIHNEFFSAIERDFSTSIMTNTSRKFDTYVAQGVMLNNYANIFGLIMQMRQVADHPDLLLKKKSVEGSQNVYVCNICDEPAEGKQKL
jgi:DNA repair protein RAD16